MDINFSEELPNGKVDFTGTLSKEEVSFLLRFALLYLLQQGLIPAAITVTGKAEGLQEATEDNDSNPQQERDLSTRKDLN